MQLPNTLGRGSFWSLNSADFQKKKKEENEVPGENLLIGRGDIYNNCTGGLKIPHTPIGTCRNPLETLVDLKKKLASLYMCRNSQMMLIKQCEVTTISDYIWNLREVLGHPICHI